LLLLFCIDKNAGHGGQGAATRKGNAFLNFGEELSIFKKLLDNASQEDIDVIMKMVRKILQLSLNISFTAISG